MFIHPSFDQVVGKHLLLKLGGERLTGVDAQSSHRLSHGVGRDLVLADRKQPIGVRGGQALPAHHLRNGQLRKVDLRASRVARNSTVE